MIKINLIISEFFQLFPEAYMVFRWADQLSRISLTIYLLAVIGGFAIFNWTVKKVV